MPFSILVAEALGQESNGSEAQEVVKFGGAEMPGIAHPPTLPMPNQHRHSNRTCRSLKWGITTGASSSN